MILQALTQLYEDLVFRGEIPCPGWNPAKISYALCLDERGSLEYVLPIMKEVQVGKKTQLRPAPMELPAAVTRTVGILPNFLWDNSSYLLGIDEKGKPERSQHCFEASGQLHHQLLDGVDTPAAKAILAFFDTWKPQEAQNHPALADCLQEVQKGGNLVFRIVDTYAQDDPGIRQAWNNSYGETEGENSNAWSPAVRMCLHRCTHRSKAFLEPSPAARQWYLLMPQPSVPTERSKVSMHRWEDQLPLPIRRR